MQAFSSTVRDLYALAEYASPDQFLTQAIGLLQNWIRFDGALFGTGEAAQKNALAGLPLAANELKAIVPEPVLSKSQFEDDPVARGFRSAPASPARGGIRELYRKSKAAAVNGKAKQKSSGRTLAEELGLCHLMVHGDDPDKVKPARWIVLYRSNDVRFAQTDAACLHGLWIHLSRAIVINRTKTLERHTSSNDDSASGLINMQGSVDIADSRFFDLLEREWPDLAPQTVPQVALDELQAGNTWRGTQIEISLVRQHGFNLCRVRPIHAMEILTPREFVVARRFAAGMSHKQIARELGVSHHTVRNQLAHLYHKLNLHDKAALAHYLISNSAPAR